MRYVAGLRPLARSGIRRGAARVSTYFWHRAVGIFRRAEVAGSAEVEPWAEPNDANIAKASDMPEIAVDATWPSDDVAPNDRVSPVDTVSDHASETTARSGASLPHATPNDRTQEGLKIRPQMQRNTRPGDQKEADSPSDVQRRVVSEPAAQSQSLGGATRQPAVAGMTSSESGATPTSGLESAGKPELSSDAGSRRPWSELASIVNRAVETPPLARRPILASRESPVVSRQAMGRAQQFAAQGKPKNLVRPAGMLMRRANLAEAVEPRLKPPLSLSFRKAEGTDVARQDEAGVLPESALEDGMTPSYSSDLPLAVGSGAGEAGLPAVASAHTKDERPLSSHWDTLVARTTRQKPEKAPDGSGQEATGGGDVYAATSGPTEEGHLVARSPDGAMPRGREAAGTEGGARTLRDRSTMKRAESSRGEGPLVSRSAAPDASDQVGDGTVANRRVPDLSGEGALTSEMSAPEQRATASDVASASSEEMASSGSVGPNASEPGIDVTVPKGYVPDISGESATVGGVLSVKEAVPTSDVASSSTRGTLLSRSPGPDRRALETERTIADQRASAVAAEISLISAARRSRVLRQVIIPREGTIPARRIAARRALARSEAAGFARVNALSYKGAESMVPRPTVHASEMPLIAHGESLDINRAHIETQRYDRRALPGLYFGRVEPQVAPSLASAEPRLSDRKPEMDASIFAGFMGSQRASTPSLRPVVQRSGAEMPSSLGTPSSQLAGMTVSGEATDMEAIARDVYRILKRRLQRERERALGII